MTSWIHFMKPTANVEVTFPLVKSRETSVKDIFHQPLCSIGFVLLYQYLFCSCAKYGSSKK